MDLKETGSLIKKLREEKNMTQEELALKLGVTGKAVSKWETGKGYPDITLMKSIALNLGISLDELFLGNEIKNSNISHNMMRSKIYVCPICSNTVIATGNLQMTCCGVSLIPLDEEVPEENHCISISNIEGEAFIEISHPMTKEHYISFIAYVTGDKINLVKLYPEGSPSARIPVRESGYIYFFCNRHGLFKTRFKRASF